MASLNILLIEDDQIEIMKFQRIVDALSRKHKTTTIADGEAAMDYLLEAAVLPELILLDLNMPKMNGIEFLKLLKKDDRLYHIPVVILTTSDNSADILAGYRAGIAGYITKPLKYDEYKKRLLTLLDYWSINQMVQPTNLVS